MESRLLLSRDIFVDANPTISTHDGAGWSTAFADLQQALSLATAGDTIKVADGTYKPTTAIPAGRTISFPLKSGVRLYGGYAGYNAPDPDARDWIANPTVLSGDIGSAGDNSDNSYHVVTSRGVSALTILDGFTITGGNANGSFSNDQDCGGGLYNTVSKAPVLNDCIFSGNSARFGGGIYNYSSFPALTNCTFRGNSCYIYGIGGGIYSVSSSPILTNCTFSGNSASSAGAMYNAYSPVTLTGCVFTGNSAHSTGGGMFNDHSSAALTNCLFSGNSASSGGGMFNANSSPMLADCTFAGNSASSAGGGMYNTAVSNPILTNCIVWGSGNTPLFNDSGTPQVTYSDIQGGYSGAGTIDADPQFIRSPWTGPDGVFGTSDDDYGDLRLRPGSAALDIGSNAGIPPSVSTDAAGNTRVQNGTVDLGAYEGPVSAPAARVLYVDGDAAGGNTGTSWTDAFNSLQSALFAATDGDTIHIADGTYKPSTAADRLAGFALRNAVPIYGAYAGYAAPNPDARSIVATPTILSGDIANTGTTSDNSYHVLTATGVDSFTVLDGITVTLGSANGPYPPDQSPFDWKQIGGGLYLAGSLPILTNCTFSGNYAVWGGGIYIAYSSSPTLTNCTFSGNSAHDGGGIYIAHSSSPTLTTCTFSGNSADYGGGIDNSSSSAMLAACTFIGNWAYDGGGIGNSSSAMLTNCTFTGNSASSSGGGMYNYSASPTLTNCTFTGNFASSYGGAINNSGSSNSTLTNCSFTGNSAYYGGGIYNYSSSPAVTNSTFAGNSASSAGGGIYNFYASSPTLTNCILWDSGSTPIYNSSSTPAVTYSDIQGGYSGIGNINADPLFIRNPSTGPDNKWGTADDDYGDLRLQLASPCIDSGNNAAVPAAITIDLTGNVRFGDVPSVADTGAGTPPIVDIGAYEAQYVQGTAGQDLLTIQRDSRDASTVQVTCATFGGPTQSWKIPVVQLAAQPFNAYSGDDTIELDFSTGLILPAAGIAVDGGADNDILRIIGTPGADSIASTHGQATFGGKPIAVANIESVELDGAGGNDVVSISDDTAITFTAPQHLASLALTGAAQANLASGMLVTGTLAMEAETKLNLNGNDLLVGTGYLPAIRSLIVSGAIQTIPMAAPMPGKVTALGYAQGDDSAVAWMNNTFNGEAFGPTGALVKNTYVADANLDGCVDGSDVALWAQNFTGALGANPASPRTWTQGDWNADGSVDGSDVALWAQNFTGALGGGGLSSPPPVATSAAIAPWASAAATTAAPARRQPARRHHKGRVAQAPGTAGADGVYFRSTR